MRRASRVSRRDRSGDATGSTGPIGSDTRSIRGRLSVEGREAVFWAAVVLEAKGHHGLGRRQALRRHVQVVLASAKQRSVCEKKNL